MRRQRELIAATIVAGICAGHAATAAIVFSDFSDVSPLQLNGEIQPATVDGQAVLRIATQGYAGGSAFLKQAINLQPTGGGFTTFFSFRMADAGGFSDSDGIGSDGLTFTIQSVGSTALGGGGGYLGYADGFLGPGIDDSIAVELDIYDNVRAETGATNIDVDGNHVGIDLNGDWNSLAQAPVSPRLNNGQVWFAWIDYVPTNGMLEVRLSQGSSRPLDAILQYALDIGSIVELDSVYAGFTGVGRLGTNIDVLTWRFGALLQQVPEPATLALFGLGLAGLAFARRKRFAA